MRKFTVIIALAMVVLGACGGSNNTNTPPTVDPALRITEYLTARVKPDVDKMIGLSCATWEPNARLEAQSTEGRNAMLSEGTKCTTTTVEGSTAYASCTGKINTSYNGEARAFNLGERQFKLAVEGDDWKMCGYK